MALGRDFTFLKDKTFGGAVIAAPIFYLVYGVFFFDSTLFSALSANNSKQLILLILLFPIIEELTFRGYIQTKITGKLGKKYLIVGISLANIITSILFSFVHLINQPITWSVLVFVPSLVFGYFSDKYESTKPSILLHVLYNAGYFILF